LYDGKKYAFASGIVYTGQTSIITGNFVFVQSRTICVSLYYKDNLQDVACYDPTKDASPVIYSG
jgi:hypothetical protein